jgi:hypothetical protein
MENHSTANPEIPVSANEKEMTPIEAAEALQQFRADIAALQWADKQRVERHPEQKKTPNFHLMAIRATDLLPKDMEWYQRLTELDFSTEEGAKDYQHVAKLFFDMRERLSREFEQEFLRNHPDIRPNALGVQISRDNYAELSAMRDNDSRYNYYAWLAHEFTSARLKQRQMFSDKKVVLDASQDAA